MKHQQVTKIRDKKNLMHYFQHGHYLILWISQHYSKLLRPVPPAAAAAADVPLLVGLLLLGWRSWQEQMPESKHVNHRIHAHIGRVRALHAPRSRPPRAEACRGRRARTPLQAAEHHAPRCAHPRALRRHRRPRPRGSTQMPRRAVVLAGIRGGGRRRGGDAGQEWVGVRLLALQGRVRGAVLVA